MTLYVYGFLALMVVSVLGSKLDRWKESQWKRKS